MNEATRQDDPNRNDPSPSGGTARAGDASVGHGFTWRGHERDHLVSVIEDAFDYRGNITLHLQGDEDLEGFLFNRRLVGGDEFVELFAKDGERRRVPYASIVGVTFSGRDTAAGKSWENWVKKYNVKKEAEARGEQVGSIDLFPDDLEEG